VDASGPATPSEATLRDGSQIRLRRVTPADAPRLEEAFAQLSEESRRLRFLTAKPHLTQAELEYLTQVDGHNHEALAVIDPATGDGVGIGRWVRDLQDPTRAEVAVTVADAWQGRGMGTLLLDQLSERARQEGITKFTALVAADNLSMQQLLKRLDAPIQKINPVGEAAEYEIELGARGLATRLQDALRAAAEGNWRVPPRLWEALRSLVPFNVSRR
jgi:RimJ/RimL family protein N-acetyltransferase